jgi:hypothetical protein
MNPTSTTPAPAAVDEARNLLAAVLDADLDPEPLLAACEAYNHLESTHAGLWTPPVAAELPNPAAALDQVHALLTDTLHERQHALDPIELALTIRATATALALLRSGGDAA